jgi:hypothetical protein
LAGHIALFQIGFSLPLYFYFMFKRYVHGTLTLSFSVLFLAWTLAAGAAVATAGWFTVGKDRASSGRNGVER